MNITSAKYYKAPKGKDNEGIEAVIDGNTMHIPIFVGNRHYDEIQKQVKAGTLTIKDAD
tara:strand:+ start:383 stop:559 length:177 start_codon:yes stop_codon:yes gene_type:complete